MDIRHIEHFMKLAETEHVSKTAEFFNITQPSLSKSLSLLESEIGAKLFDRTGNRIHLNDTGRVYLAYAKNAFELLQSGALAAAGSSHTARRELAIRYDIYPSIISEPLEQYLLKNPDIVYISITQRGDQSRPFISIYSLPADQDTELSDEWIDTELFKEQYLLISSPRYSGIDITGLGGDLRLLRKERFVAFSSSDNLLVHDATIDICMSAGFYPFIAVNTGEFLQKIHSIDSGNTIGIIPECCLSDALRLSPDLISVPITDERFTRRIYARYRAAKAGSEVITDFIDYLSEYYKRER